jgi:hypothetical protein
MNIIRTKSKHSLEIKVDENTYNEMNAYIWMNKKKGNIYTIYTVIDGKEKSLSNILYNTSQNQIVIHLDNDQYNYCKSNIKILSRQEYAHLYIKFHMKNRSSEYNNVNFDSTQQKWHTKIIKDNKVVYDQYFEFEDEAALVADYISSDIYGENTQFNFDTFSIEVRKRKYLKILEKYGSTRKEIKSRSTQGRSRVSGKSKYVGVGYDERREKWFARVKYNGKGYWCGYHLIEVDAAIAYNSKALELYGEDARLNKFE